MATPQILNLASVIANKTWRIYLHNGIRRDGLHRGNIINIHIPSCALALPPLKILRFRFTPANWAAKCGVSWAADLKAKLQMVPESSTPSLFLFSSTAVAKQQFGTSSVLPQTSSLSSALPGTCTHAQPCCSPGCSLQGAQDHQALFMGMSAQKQTQC